MKIKIQTLIFSIVLLASNIGVGAPDQPKSEKSIFEKGKDFFMEGLSDLGLTDCSNSDFRLESELKDKIMGCGFKDGDQVSEQTFFDCFSQSADDFKKIQGPSCQKKYQKLLQDHYRSLVIQRVKRIDFEKTPEEVRADLSAAFELMQVWQRNLNLIYNVSKDKKLSPAEFARIHSPDLSEVADQLWTRVFNRGKSSILQAAKTHFSDGLGRLNQILRVALIKDSKTSKGKQKSQVDPSVQLILAGQVLNYVNQRLEFFADNHDLICDIQVCGVHASENDEIVLLVSALSRLDAPGYSLSKEGKETYENLAKSALAKKAPKEVMEFLQILTHPDWQSGAFKRVSQIALGGESPQDPALQRYSQLNSTIPEYAIEFVEGILQLSAMDKSFQNIGKFSQFGERPVLELTFKEDTLANVHRILKERIIQHQQAIDRSVTGNQSALQAWDKSASLSAEQTLLESNSAILAKQSEQVFDEIVARQSEVRNTANRFADYLQQMKDLLGSKRWATHYKNQITQGEQTLFTVRGADAKYNDQAVSQISALAVNSSSVPLSVQAGDIVSLNVSGKWSPTCAVSRSEYKAALQSTIGPEGYSFMRSEGHSSTSGRDNSYSQHWDNSTKSSLTAGLNVSVTVGTPFERILGSGVKATGYVDANISRTLSSGHGGSETDFKKTADETRSSASFEEGLRLPHTPFGRFPAGSLLLVQLVPGKTDLSSIQDIQIVRSFTQVVMPSDSDLYFIVNDCKGDSQEALTVSYAQQRPLGAEAQLLSNALLSATRMIDENAAVFLRKGDISPVEMEALRGKVITQISKQGLEPNQIELLNKIFLGTVSTELAQLENKVKLVQLEKRATLTYMELQKVATALEQLKTRKQLSELEVLWANENIDIRGIGSELQKVSEFLRRQLIPVLKIRFPRVLAELAKNEHLKALGSIGLNTTTRSLAYQLGEFLKDLDAKLLLDVNRQQPDELFVMLSFPRTILGANSQLTYDQIISATEVPFVSPLLAAQPWKAFASVLPIEAGGSGASNPDTVGIFQVRPIDLYTGTRMTIRKDGKDELIKANSNGLPLHAVAPVVTGMGLYFQVDSSANAALLKRLSETESPLEAEIVSENEYPMEHGSERFALPSTLSKFKIPIYFGDGISPRNKINLKSLKDNNTQRKGLSPFASYSVDFGNTFFDKPDFKNIAKDIKEIIFLFTVVYRNAEDEKGIPWLIANREQAIYRNALTPLSVAPPVEPPLAIAPVAAPVISGGSLSKEDLKYNKVIDSSERLDSRVNDLLRLAALNLKRAQSAFQDSNLKEKGLEIQALLPKLRLRPGDSAVLESIMHPGKMAANKKHAKIRAALKEHLAQVNREDTGAHSENGPIAAAEARTHYFNMTDQLSPGAGYFSHSIISQDALVEGSDSLMKLVKSIKKQIELGKPSWTGVIEGPGHHFATLAIDLDEQDPNRGQVAWINPLKKDALLSGEQEAAIMDALDDEEVHSHQGTHEIIDFGRAIEVVNGAQCDSPQNSIVLSILNARQIAKEGKISGYKSVTASLEGGHVNSYEDIYKIGNHGKLDLGQPQRQDEGMSDFLKSFRLKTRELVEEFKNAKP